jgi:hypothetical protein
VVVVVAMAVVVVVVVVAAAAAAAKRAVKKVPEDNARRPRQDGSRMLTIECPDLTRKQSLQWICVVFHVRLG